MELHRPVPAQAVEQPAEELLLVVLEGPHRLQHPGAPVAGLRREPGQVVHGGGGAHEQLVGQGAELEAFGHVVLRRQQLVGVELLPPVRRRHDDTVVRAEELVGRAGVEVGAGGGEVHRRVRGQVHPVDVQQGAGLVHGVGDPRQVWPGPEDVGGAGDGDEPGAPGQHRTDVVHGELCGVAVELDPAQLRTHGLGCLHPRAHVPVVVEPGDDHLVVRSPRPGQGACDVVGRLGHRSREDHASRVGTEQVGHRRTRVRHRRLSALLGPGDDAPVGDACRHRPRDRVSHLARHLGPARPVEECDTLTKCREVAAHAVDVVVHAPILPAPQARLPTRCGRFPRVTPRVERP